MRTMRSALVLLVMVSACGGAPSQASVTPARKVASQSQALVESATGTYSLQFVVNEGGDDRAALGLLREMHELSVSEGDGELRIRLSSADMRLDGLADELDEHRWIAGLAGVIPETNVPIVVHMTALHAGDALTGSVVIDAGETTHTASFLARRASQTPARAAVVDADDGAQASSTHYHLPVGVR